jgi:hypothetical protein
VSIQLTMDFVKHHTKRMSEMKDLIRKWCQDFDEYTVENSQFVSEQISLHETYCLQTTNESQTFEQRTSIIDLMLPQKKTTLESARTTVKIHEGQSH